MATRIFRSSLAPRLQAFAEMRRVCSGRYDSCFKILRYIDRFLVGELPEGEPISRKVIERFNEDMMHLNPNTRLNRLSVLRQFCAYLVHFDPRTCLVLPSFAPRRTRPAPYIYSRTDVRKIMAAARRLGPKGSLRPLVISTLIGLLYATGLRIGEALGLTLSDVDMRRRVIEVRKGKFGKSRYVPISSSTARRLKEYLRHREAAGFSTAPDAPVFISLIGRRHGHPSFVTAFLEIIRNIGIRGPKGVRGQRVHDLRHTFAVGRLLAWYRLGSNLGSKLPLLSTYLGHSTVTGTQVYLHATAELLQSAGRRFHEHFALPLVGMKHHGAH